LELERPEIRNTTLCLFLSLFHLYKKKLPIDNKTPPTKDPTIAPIKIAEDLLDDSDGCELTFVVVGDIVIVGEGSKISVHM
jgi:hypothetical protein